MGGVEDGDDAAAAAAGGGGGSHRLRLPWRRFSVKPDARRSSERYHFRWYTLPMVLDAPW